MSEPRTINNLDDAWNLADMLHSYFDKRSDVVDGDYGIPKPNAEMNFAKACADLMDWLETLND